MSRCVRQGSRYKRHKYKDGKCKKCGVLQTEHLKDVAAKREARKKAKRAK